MPADTVKSIYGLGWGAPDLAPRPPYFQVEQTWRNECARMMYLMGITIDQVVSNPAIARELREFWLETKRHERHEDAKAWSDYWAWCVKQGCHVDLQGNQVHVEIPKPFIRWPTDRAKMVRILLYAYLAAMVARHILW